MHRGWALLLVFAVHASAHAQAEPAAPAPPDAPALSPRARLLDAELRELEQRRSEITMTMMIPAVMTGVGAVTAGLSLPLYMMTGLCAISEADDACDGRDDKQRVIMIIGISGAVVGAVGLIWLLERHATRRALDARIERLREDRSAVKLGWDVRAGPRYLHARLCYAF